MTRWILLLCLALPAAVFADDDDWEDAAEERRERLEEQREDAREREEERREAEREWAEERREAEREWAEEAREEAEDREEERREAARDSRDHVRGVARHEREAQRGWQKAHRERQKALREAQRAMARDGWFVDGRWERYDGEYRYRDERWQAIRTYPAPAHYTPPARFEVVVYEPGLRLPSTYVTREYVIGEPQRYGLPPPPPRHHWVQVDDDAVLVALTSGVVADFVYDLFR